LLIGWFLYLFWYSTFSSRKSKELIVGNKLPEFNVEDASGNTVSSTNFLGKPAIYLFYRGNWCSLCMAQIKEVVQQYKELEKRNVTMVLISSQPYKFTKVWQKNIKCLFNFW
jgi:peroxiredoxin